ncbi:MAG: PQQ-like beta-propeller repeat protein [Pirellulales bacterium]|nr:PQQ-like beta-propeller repeat protein [Pirellulales bacterium]
MTQRRLLLATLASLTLSSALALMADRAAAEDWPQWRGPNRDGVWTETGIVDKFAAPQLAIKWRAPLGSGYSGPTVAAGRVYVTDRLVEPKQQERVWCFDEQTGKALWSHVYDCTYVGVGYVAGPRASVTIEDGRAYSLGTMGDLFCFDAATGSVHWSHRLKDEYDIDIPGWGLTASPLVEGNLVILHIGGAEKACVVALDTQTGGERWRALPDKVSYSSPIVIEQAGRRVLVVWTGDHVAGLDPQSGKILWQEPFPPKRMVIGVATPIVSRNRLFVTSFYDGAMLLELASDHPAAAKLWHRAGANEIQTDAIQPIIATPMWKGDHIYGVDSYGQLRCLDAKNGDRVWENLTATPNVRWGTIHFVNNGDRTWMFNELGELLITRLSPQGYEELSRAKLIEPTTEQLRRRGDQGVCWSHPAFANRHVFARNDVELVAASLAAE